MKKILLALLVAFPLALQAQWADDYYKPASQPRVYFGGDAAFFRISLNNFNTVYSSRWGESYGGFVGVRAFGAHYITARYGSFEKGGKEGVHPPTGEDLKNARWREQWIKIGLRIHPPVAGRWGSYYGFGLGFFDVKENDPISVFDTLSPQKESKPSTGSGFYLEFGIDYFVMNRLAAFFDIEVSSGGTRGRSSFEAMSVGGWRFSTGLVFWLF